MISTSDSCGNAQTRTYDRADSIVFLKTNEPFGGLSNMASGFPLRVNGIRIPTSEALYQACRFPHLPHVQKLIIEQRSPMTAKMKSKPHRRNSRPDWDQVRVKIMRWCLRVKLAQNWGAFSKLLLGTGDRPIVEQSRKDEFWGAEPVDEHTLVGVNVLGRLLMELREAVKAEDRESLLRVEPLAIRDFLLDGRPIETVTAQELEEIAPIVQPAEHPSRGSAGRSTGVQASLFDPPAPKEAQWPDYSCEGAAAAGIADLKPYPAMKDSGAPWLGEVPKHWEVERLKARAANIIEQAAERESGALYIALEHVESWTGRLRESGPKVTFDSQVKRFRADDVLFGKLRPYLAKVTRPIRAGVCVSEFLVLRPRGDGLSPAYLEQLIRSKPVIDAINASTFGAKMPRADWQFVGGMGLSFPPLPEQAAIVRFLDHADRRIRRYIRAKQKLIKLLEEQKQAIIHRAVTRGLDPANSPGANLNGGQQAGGPKGEGRDSPSNVRLKPSGVEWLGDVPEHWEVRRLGRFAKVFNGTTPSRMESAYWLGGTIPWLSSGKVNDYTVEAASELVTERALRECSISIVPKGAVIIGLVGQGKTRAKSAILGIDACINQNLAAIVPLRALTGTFLLHFLTAFYPTFREFGRGGNQEALNCEIVANWRVPIPSEDEQGAVCEYLRIALAGLREAEKRVNREVNLLREYRTRLIADVVTGKLDVREAAAQLPDETEESEDVGANDYSPLQGGTDDEPVDDLDVAKRAEG